MKEIKTLEQVDPHCYFNMLALLYKIKPEDKDDFIKSIDASAASSAFKLVTRKLCFSLPANTSLTSLN